PGEGRVLAPSRGTLDEGHRSVTDAQPVLVQERHRPTLTSTATTSSSFDVCTSTATNDGGSVRVRMVRTGATASGSASRPSRAQGCEIPITTIARNEPA